MPLQNNVIAIYIDPIAYINKSHRSGIYKLDYQIKQHFQYRKFNPIY